MPVICVFEDFFKSRVRIFGMTLKGLKIKEV